MESVPVGILTDVSVTFAGGLVGCLISSRLQDNWKKMLNNMLGIAAVFMGITLMLRAKNLSAVVLALLLGASMGELIQLEDRINKAATVLTAKLISSNADADYLARVSAALILFSFSGSGWYGSLNEGLTGDSSILITKSILDCIAACIFAAIIGKIIPCLCVPQLMVFITLFFISRFVQPYITDIMIDDFSALGGIITFVAGLRLCKIKEDIKGLNLLPGLIIVFFVSAAWTAMLG